MWKCSSPCSAVVPDVCFCSDGWSDGIKAMGGLAVDEGELGIPRISPGP